jgi:limonene-1,2-epoxide hydrolase
MGTGTDSPDEVVRRFCDAVTAMDAEALRPFFADDVVYHNIPMEPAVGIDATIVTLAMFIGMCTAMRFDIHHLAVQNEAVLTERTDVFTMGTVEAPIPVMGVFEIADGRITAWRDYFDMAQVTALFSGGG